MGAVFVGEHTLLGRRAAIKLLLPAFSADTAIVERFFNEAKATTLIAEPGIVQIFDFGYTDDGSAFIVMELLEGEPLATRLHRVGRFGAVEAVRIARLMSVSLAAAHARGIVHRDLKPENVYLVADAAIAGGERPKILDFGIAKLSRDPGRTATQTGALLGTPQFMSPEQCRGTAELDGRSDLYSLACVLFAMLTGEPPFAYEAAGELIVAHVTEPAPLVSSRRPGVPPELDAIVARSLAKDPAERFQTMAELAEVLAGIEDALKLGPQSAITPASISIAVAASAPTITATSGQMVSTVAPARRRRMRTVIACAASVVALGAVAIALSLHGSDATAASDAGSSTTIALPVVPVAPAVVPPPPPPADAAMVETTIDAANTTPPPHHIAHPPKHPHAQTTHTDAAPPVFDRGD
jgi:serine/threonine-protein kinase